ncbi:LPXTG cell wall anchor domain-containing protein [Arthrobacter sp. HMWF013]|uniref:LPXTG cell wall anchor domain-containing protein n=1 Tax=Arthrobacter sp. HMWF013 TaxID=2056849 RepID=UPI000D345B25|nr:LPXTG cell wall anchor domain-containing protein [Arthrobacter sp. HMWF013]PTT65280.1 peptidase [Arthrobacter sp. HMWF013]
MKKALAALALAGSLALVGSAPAVAARYPAIPPQAAVSDGTVGPGEQFVFSGQGPFQNQPLTIRVTPGNAPASGGASIAGGRSFSSKISVFLEAQTLATQADGEGKFSVPVTINEAGSYVLTATSDVTGYTVGPVRVVVAAGFANNGAAGSNAGGNNGTPASLANSGTALANTGADSGLVLWTLVGAGALAAGAASVVVVRRRAKTEAAA